MARHTSPNTSGLKAPPKHLKALHAKPSGRSDLPQRRSGLTRKQVEAHALETFGSQAKASHWLNRPNPLFHGKTPQAVIEIDPQCVEAELARIDHGVYV